MTPARDPKQWFLEALGVPGGLTGQAGGSLGAWLACGGLEPESVIFHSVSQCLSSIPPVSSQRNESWGGLEPESDIVHCVLQCLSMLPPCFVSAKREQVSPSTVNTDEFSRALGARPWGSAHSPYTTRPGPLQLEAVWGIYIYIYILIQGASHRTGISHIHTIMQRIPYSSIGKHNYYLFNAKLQ